MTQEIITGLAAIIEADNVTAETRLDSGSAPWDSLAIVCTIALLDEKAGVQVSGQALAECETVGQVLCLVAERT